MDGQLDGRVGTRGEWREKQKSEQCCCGGCLSAVVRSWSPLAVAAESEQIGRHARRLLHAQQRQVDCSGRSGPTHASVVCAAAVPVAGAWAALAAPCVACGLWPGEPLFLTVQQINQSHRQQTTTLRSTRSGLQIASLSTTPFCSVHASFHDAASIDATLPTYCTHCNGRHAARQARNAHWQLPRLRRPIPPC